MDNACLKIRTPPEERKRAAYQADNPPFMAGQAVATMPGVYLISLRITQLHDHFQLDKVHP